MLLFKKSALWTIIININGHFESFLLTWISKKWGLFYKKFNLYIFFQILFLVIWIIAVVFFLYPVRDTFFFTIFYPSIGAFFSVTMINKLAKATGKPLYDDPRFFVCIGLLIYFLGGLLPALLASNPLEMSELFKKRMLNLADGFVTLMYLIFTYSLILMVKNPPSKNSKNSYALPLEKITNDWQ